MVKVPPAETPGNDELTWAIAGAFASAFEQAAGKVPPKPARRDFHEQVTELVESIAADAANPVPESVLDDVRGLLIVAIEAIHDERPGARGFRSLLALLAARARGRSRSEMWADIEKAAKSLLEWAHEAPELLHPKARAFFRDTVLGVYLSDIRDEAGTVLQFDCDGVADVLSRTLERPAGQRGARRVALELGRIAGQQSNEEALKKAVNRSRNRR